MFRPNYKAGEEVLFFDVLKRTHIKKVIQATRYDFNTKKYLYQIRLETYPIWAEENQIKKLCTPANHSFEGMLVILKSKTLKVVEQPIGVFTWKI